MAMVSTMMCFTEPIEKRQGETNATVWVDVLAASKQAPLYLASLLLPVTYSHTTEEEIRLFSVSAGKHADFSSSSLPKVSGVILLDNYARLSQGERPYSCNGIFSDWLLLLAHRRLWAPFFCKVPSTALSAWTRAPRLSPYANIYPILVLVITASTEIGTELYFFETSPPSCAHVFKRLNMFSNILIHYSRSLNWVA